MEYITPCRNVLDDRFPVVSFVVRVPEQRTFEVACATDPRLFSTAWQGRRTETNFYTSRPARAVGGETTVVLPARQLARFAGNRRLYYMLGSYGSRETRDARFSVPPGAAGEAPFVRVAPDFTGRHLGRSLGAAAYGGRLNEARLTWGGDSLGGPGSAGSDDIPYDDGFDPALFEQPSPSYGYVVDPAAIVAARESPAHPDDYRSAAAAIVRSQEYEPPAPIAEPPGLEEPPRIESRYGGLESEEPPGLEEPPPVEGNYGSRGAEGPPGLEEPPGLAEPPAQDGAYGGRCAAPVREVSEPEGFEDPSELMATTAAYGASHSPSSQPALPPAPAQAPSPPSQASQQTPELTTDQLVPVVRSLIRHRGIDEYSHVGTDGAGGLSIGQGRFRQSDGSLRRLLASTARRDEAWYPGRRSLFDHVFGPRRADAIREWADNGSDQGPIDGEYLTAPSWREALRRSGRLHLAPPEGLGIAPHDDPFKAAQNEALVHEVLLPALPLAKQLGLESDRGLAVLVETLLEHGPERGRDWLQGLHPGGRPTIADIVDAAAVQGHANASRLRKLATEHDDLKDTVLVTGS